MSLRRRAINLILRLAEKPHLARVEDPRRLRDGFERRAAFWFPPPPGSRFRLVRGAAEILWVGSETDVEDAAILHFHGGGYVFGSPRTHAAMLARLSRLSGLPAFLPRYRLAPEHPFPAALEDAEAAFDALRDRDLAPDRIVIGGDSAGGGLALALLARLCARGVRPACAYALSPLTDMTFSGESFTRNRRADPLLPAQRAVDLEKMYLAGADPRDPRASPLFAEFPDAPPVFLAAGSTEILLDDTRRMADRLAGQAVAVETRIGHALPHVWPFFQGWLPEADQTLTELARWIRRHLAPSDGS